MKNTPPTDRRMLEEVEVTLDAIIDEHSMCPTAAALGSLSMRVSRHLAQGTEETKAPAEADYLPVEGKTH